MSSQQLYINSADRNSGTSNNFRIQLRESIKFMEHIKLQNIRLDNQAYAQDIFIVIKQFRKRNFGTNANLAYTFMIPNLYAPAGLVDFNDMDFKQIIDIDPEHHIYDLEISLVDRNGAIIPSLTLDWSITLKIYKN